MVNRMMESDSLSVADQEPLGASFGVLPSVALDHFIPQETKRGAEAETCSYC